VLGGLQHHGNIRRKAVERALGTVIGAVAGLLVIVGQTAMAPVPVSYVVIPVACAVCGYHAIGKGGYIALLAAITIYIVAGHGGNTIADGLWRTADVLVGIAMAMLFSFALPLYATYAWRNKLADALRGCARMHAALAGSRPIDKADLDKTMATLATLLVQMRSLMPSVNKETDISPAQLEAIQHSLRVCISMLELLSAMPSLTNWADLCREHRRLSEMLVGMSRALRFGTLSRLAPRARGSAPFGVPPAELAGQASMTQALAHEFDVLRERLAATAAQWNLGTEAAYRQLLP
jgi:uncharacterized membrane protein YccC